MLTGSRLKWSRWAVVDLVPNQVAEALIRTLADHFVAFGGVPLCRCAWCSAVPRRWP